MPQDVITEDPPSSGRRPRRSDALRNIDAILEAAGRLLPNHPRASMQEVAEAAGVHRATVHRHFPSRDDLLEALRRRSLDGVQALLNDSDLVGGDPGDALERLTAEVMRQGDRNRTWRILPAYDAVSDERAAALRAPLLALMRRAHSAGAVRTDISPELLIAFWGGLLISMLPHIAKGELTVEQAAAQVRRMLAAP